MSIRGKIIFVIIIMFCFYLKIYREPLRIMSFSVPFLCVINVFLLSNTHYETTALLFMEHFVHVHHCHQKRRSKFLLFKIWFNNTFVKEMDYNVCLWRVQ